eukprot:TRINITY_DN11055_c0_g1_i1.p1 TRINITY_DN11055_c0_g1~~TRINITY_DN11055_c0_g1_i1.p1  ORF type:complete len:153 (+),score=21.91 TRINITY_DN11055_c0_g1_i1:23-460(+)
MLGGEVFVRTFLFYGTEIISETDCKTDCKPLFPHPRWSQWLSNETGGIVYSRLPRATRACFLVCIRSPKLRIPEIVGWVVCNLIDELGVLQRGIQIFNLWALEGDKAGLEEIDEGYMHFIFEGARVTTFPKLKLALSLWNLNRLR